MDALTVILGILLSLVAAGVPAVAWSALVWWCDRYEHEPLALGVGAFVWGALPAVALSFGVESLFQTPAALTGSVVAGDIFASSGIAPVVEELAKGIGLLLILWVWRVEFDNLLDGILYGALVGFGFGLTENLLYFMAALLDGGWGSWGVTVFLRGVVFGLNHAFFTAFTGAGIGIARAVPPGKIRRWAPVTGLGLALLFHSLHNLGAALSAVSTGALFLSLFTGTTGIVLVATMIGLALRQEAGWIRDELAEEVGQLLTEAEYRTLLSPRERLRVTTIARQASGRQAASAIRRFHELATELAFRKRRLRGRHTDVELATQVAALRQQLAQLGAATRRPGINLDPPRLG